MDFYFSFLHLSVATEEKWVEIGFLEQRPQEKALPLDQMVEVEF